jgi:hypothetical protein
MKYWFNLGNWRYVIGVLLGAATGYGYWYFYGCVNGCTITGSALNSSLYFAFMGFLLVGRPQLKSLKSTRLFNPASCRIFLFTSDLHAHYL